MVQEPPRIYIAKPIDADELFLAIAEAAPSESCLTEKEINETAASSQNRQEPHLMPSNALTGSVDGTIDLECAQKRIGGRYQARLSDDAGVPLTGTHNVSFAIYDAISGGAASCGRKVLAPWTWNRASSTSCWAR